VVTKKDSEGIREQVEVEVAALTAMGKANAAPWVSKQSEVISILQSVQFPFGSGGEDSFTCPAETDVASQRTIAQSLKCVFLP
jgi:hypothetical protein